MNEQTSLQGLSCPNCGGMVPIPEGQVIVKCPFCDMRSFVKGERGLRRYQVQQRVPREAAVKSMQQFLSKNFAVARDAVRQAQVTEVFLAYLPFWVVWERMAGWAFGQVRVGSGDHSHYEPRENKIVEENTWNGAACDTGEFGVNEVPLTTQALEPFNPDKLHAAGMVFEPQSQPGAYLSALCSFFSPAFWFGLLPVVDHPLPVPGSRLPGSSGWL
jgi:hypothetical protein